MILDTFNNKFRLIVFFLFYMENWHEWVWDPQTCAYHVHALNK